MSEPQASERDGSGGQYFDAAPASRHHRRSVPLVLPDLSLSLTTDAGVFSGDGVDAGTKFLLLDGPRPPVGATHLLDLGCGYGPIAVTVARRSPVATVWAVDVNDRARELCRENAAAAEATNVIVAGPDEVPGDLAFDAIWSNPPIRIGKAALHDLLRTWLDRLAPGGWATLVVQKHLGADSLARWLAGQGWPTERLASRQGYRLLQVAGRAGNG